MSTPDAEPWFHDVWRRVCARLRTDMDDKYYAYWIGSLRVLSATPGSIVIACKSPFRRDQTVDKFGQRIADLIALHVPHLGKIDFVFDDLGATPPPRPVKLASDGARATDAAACVAVEPANERRVSMEEIKKYVAEIYHVTPGDLESPSRKKSVVRPRQIAMLVTRRVTRRSFPQIAMKYGNRDHTTAIHSCRTVERRMAFDAILAAEVDALMRHFTEQKTETNSGGGANN